ncbi:MAG TPA: hypothetical protein VMU04_07405 [Candidatus Acidoferrum sp.]|nr:hypothetical protein [Candidatus Acidoferrum sp.]
MNFRQYLTQPVVLDKAVNHGEGGQGHENNEASNTFAPPAQHQHAEQKDAPGDENQVPGVRGDEVPSLRQPCAQEDERKEAERNADEPPRPACDAADDSEHDRAPRARDHLRNPLWSFNVVYRP